MKPRNRINEYKGRRKMGFLAQVQQRRQGSTPFLAHLGLHRLNQFRWSTIQTPAQSENRIHRRHPQAPLDQRNISTFNFGNFSQLFLSNTCLAPQSGKDLPNDAFQFLRFFERIQKINVSGSTPHFLAL
jgi:hypothetical protein